jgi:hypothetical protein
MKQIKIHGYNLAIVVVNRSLHITVTSDRSEISLQGFNNQKETSLAIFNEFTETFKTLPTEWNARRLACHQDKIILILK